MIDITGLREDKRPQSSTIVHALLDRLEAAEKERDATMRLADSLALALNTSNHERDNLRAKIAEMGKQEPVAFGLYSGWAIKAAYLKEHEACEQRDRRQLTADLSGSLEAYRVVPLYALPGAQPAWGSQAVLDVTAERRRQIEVEGWTPEHDDEHSSHALAEAAACYCLSSAGKPFDYFETTWPWERWWFKASGTRRDLVKAGALILAEVERLDRAAEVGRKMK